MNATDSATIELTEAHYCLAIPRSRNYSTREAVETLQKPHHYAMLCDIRRRLSSKDVVLDIGAQFGNHSIYLATSCNCTVHAFEADAVLAQTLRANIEMNALGEQICLHAEVSPALSESTDLTYFALDRIKIDAAVRAIIISSGENVPLVLEGGLDQIRRNRPYIYANCRSDAMFIDHYSHFHTIGYTYLDTFGDGPIHLFAPIERDESDSHCAGGPAMDGVSEPLESVRQLNNCLGNDYRRAPISWLAKAAHEAVRLECYDIAKGLAVLGASLQQGGAKSTVREIAQLHRVQIDAELAFGNRDAAKALEKSGRPLCMINKSLAKHALELADNLSESEVRDIVYQFFDEDVNVLAKNRLSRHEIVESYQSYPELFEKCPSLNLVLANALTTNSEYNDAWIAALRRFMRHVTSDELSSIDWNANNLPHAMTFVSGSHPTIEQPLVSIIVSAYNAASTIGTAIQSILNQSYQNIEILVCDDCSEDGTLEKIINEFSADVRVNVFKSSSNQGTYNIRNALIARSHGSYITFHDSDDIALPSRIAIQVRELAKSDAVANVCKWLRISQEGCFALPRTGVFLGMCTVSLMARAEVFARVRERLPYGPYRPSRVGADTECLQRIGDLYGTSAIQTLPFLGVLGLHSKGSLTTAHGSEALGDGYRAPVRRAYMALLLAHRLRPNCMRSCMAVDRQLQTFGAFAQPAGVEQLAAGI